MAAELDFSKCLFDPTKFSKDKKVQDVYPELLPYTDIPQSVLAWQVGICLTDIGNPFIKIKDHKQKLDAIFSHFGYSRIKGDSALEYNKALEYRPCDIIDVCVFMIEHQNNYDFAAWWTKQESYWQLAKRVIVPLRENENENQYWSEKIKNQERMAKIAMELKEIETELFGSVAMKTAAARAKKRKKVNYNEKYADENQVE